MIEAGLAPKVPRTRATLLGRPSPSRRYPAAREALTLRIYQLRGHLLQRRHKQSREEFKSCYRIALRSRLGAHGSVEHRHRRRRRLPDHRSPRTPVAASLRRGADEPGSVLGDHRSTRHSTSGGRACAIAARVRFRDGKGDRLQPVRSCAATNPCEGERGRFLAVDRGRQDRTGVQPDGARNLFFGPAKMFVGCATPIDERTRAAVQMHNALHAADDDRVRMTLDEFIELAPSRMPRLHRPIGRRRWRATPIVRPDSGRRPSIHRGRRTDRRHRDDSLRVRSHRRIGSARALSSWRSCDWRLTSMARRINR